MPKIRPCIEFMSFTIRKKHARPWGFGLSWFGHTRFGEYNPKAGVYQRRHTKKGTIFVKMKFSRPTNPRTMLQQACRLKFANAVLAWQNLTNEEKAYYNKLKYKGYKTGYAIFISKYLKGYIL